MTMNIEALHILEAMFIATVAAVPATVGSIAAWRKSDSVNKKVKTSNGDSVGKLVEMNYELAKSTSHRVDEVSRSLEVHILDQDQHCKETMKGRVEHD